MSRARILIVNPNSSEAVSERLRATAARFVGERARIEVVTCSDGPSYLGDEETMRAGEAAALTKIDGLLKEKEKPDAIVLGCFADLGLKALAQRTTLPVCTLLSASLAAATGRTAIVTAGAQWRTMLPPMVARTRGETDLVAVRTIAATGTIIAANPQAAIAELQQAVDACAALADTIVIGGAGLAGLAASLAPPPGARLLDCLQAAMLFACNAIAAGSPGQSGRPGVAASSPGKNPGN
ncbi:MAG: aspartate/glutamate racemase family protein [Reyranellaceae bacterium]